MSNLFVSICAGAPDTWDLIISESLTWKKINYKRTWTKWERKLLAESPRTRELIPDNPNKIKKYQERDDT